MADTKTNDVSIVGPTVDRFRSFTGSDGSILKVLIETKKFSDGSRTCIAKIEYVEDKKKFMCELDVITQKGINISAIMSADEIDAQLLTRPCILSTSDTCILAYPSFEAAKFMVTMDRADHNYMCINHAKIIELTEKVATVMADLDATRAELATTKKDCENLRVEKRRDEILRSIAIS